MAYKAVGKRLQQRERGWKKCFLVTASPHMCTNFVATLDGPGIWWRYEKLSKGSVRPQGSSLTKDANKIIKKENKIKDYHYICVCDDPVRHQLDWRETIAQGKDLLRTLCATKRLCSVHSERNVLAKQILLQSNPSAYTPICSRMKKWSLKHPYVFHEYLQNICRYQDTSWEFYFL